MFDFENEARLKSLEKAIMAINETLGHLIKQTEVILNVIAEQDKEIEKLKKEMDKLQKENGSQ